MDEKARIRSAGCHLLGNLVEGELPEAELAEHQPEREERRGHRPGNDDLELAEPLRLELLSGDYDRSVAGADACPVGQ